MSATRTRLKDSSTLVLARMNGAFSFFARISRRRFSMSVARSRGRYLIRLAAVSASWEYGARVPITIRVSGASGSAWNRVLTPVNSATLPRSVGAGAGLRAARPEKAAMTCFSTAGPSTSPTTMTTRFSGRYQVL